MERTYAAIRVKQQPNSREFFLIVCKAAELLEWCDVPRKAENFMAGYQRALGDRHEDIKAFLEKDPANVIPGAVIVALQEESVTITKTAISDIFELTVKMTPATFQQRVQTIVSQFYGRLSDDEKANADEISAQMLKAPNEPVPLGEQDDGEEDEELADDEIPPRSYLALLAAEMKVAATSFTALSADRQKAVEDYVNGLTKPGLILDGQHRVFGAKNVSDFDVALPVVVMPGLTISEQVFHFYVLNNKALPLKPTELRGTISTSLTNREISELYERFKLAGIKAEKARLTHRANTDSLSPFKTLIDFGIGGATAFIPENVMFQVIVKFVDMGKRYRLLYAGVEPWLADKDYDYRLKGFYRFWSAIRDKFPDAWEQAKQKGGGQLLYKATMLVLQELVLDQMVSSQPERNAKSELSPLSDLDDLEKYVRNSLYFLPEEFFTRVWMQKQLDTGERREFLYQQMQEAIRRQGKGLGYLPLFKS